MLILQKSYFLTIDFLIQNMIKISYAVNENLFAESLHLLFQNIRIARMMKDVCQVTELSIMMTTLLQRLE